MCACMLYYSARPDPSVDLQLMMLISDRVDHMTPALWIIMTIACKKNIKTASIMVPIYSILIEQTFKSLNSEVNNLSPSHQISYRFHVMGLNGFLLYCCIAFLIWDLSPFCHTCQIYWHRRLCNHTRAVHNTARPILKCDDCLQRSSCLQIFSRDRQSSHSVG